MCVEKIFKKNYLISLTLGGCFATRLLAALQHKIPKKNPNSPGTPTSARLPLGAPPRGFTLGFTAWCLARGAKHPGLHHACPWPGVAASQWGPGLEPPPPTRGLPYASQDAQAHRCTMAQAIDAQRKNHRCTPHATTDALSQTHRCCLGHMAKAHRCSHRCK